MADANFRRTVFAGRTVMAQPGISLYFWAAFLHQLSQISKTKHSRFTVESRAN
jgi:hypothetical protein